MTTQIAPAELDDLTQPPRRIGFATLSVIETRKMLDTRGGRGLLAVILVLVVGISTWQGATLGDHPLELTSFLQGPVQTGAMLVPIIGLMAMTAEFSQRTALTTFTLAPRRLSVLWAKLTAAVVLTIGVLVASIALASFAGVLTSAISGQPMSYDGTAGAVRGFLVVGVLMSVLAAAIGALVAHTPIAIAVLFVAPTAFSMLASAVLKDAAPWFDVFTAFERLSDNDPFARIDQTLCAITIWVIIPAVLGGIRAMRREVK